MSRSYQIDEKKWKQSPTNFDIDRLTDGKVYYPTTIGTGYISLGFFKSVDGPTIRIPARWSRDRRMSRRLQPG